MDYDLVIIGTGSGNSIIGPEMDGMRIAIAERGVFGGTCLNRGCIPSKMLIYPADLALQTRSS
ncbi:MAG: mycothione reductase, partial [Acidobacteria bacterium]|nr:mycothione reductase [Acidobacteriota bacterium]